MSGPRRFAVLGFPRSGTTLLARLLDAHPEVSCPPETFLLTAAARFLSEQDRVEGPHIGPLSALSLLDVPPQDVLGAIRALVFGFWDRLADGAPVQVEKTANDVFHLETLEPLLVGHVRFIAMTRHPLDLIASNIDLATLMGAQLDDLHALTTGISGPHEGLARAWIDRTRALDAFVARNADDCLVLRFEDLLTDPATTLARVFAHLGVRADPAAHLETALGRPPRQGLGDFRVDEGAALRPPTRDGWRKRLPPAATARILPLLAPLMEAHGYRVPRVPAPASRDDAVRQHQIAQRMRRATATGGAAR